MGARTGSSQNKRGPAWGRSEAVARNGKVERRATPVVRARTHANPAGSRLEISGRDPKDEGLRVASFFQVEKNALPGHAEQNGAVIL